MVYYDPDSFVMLNIFIHAEHIYPSLGPGAASPLTKILSNETERKVEMIGATAKCIFHFSLDTSGTFPEPK